MIADPRIAGVSVTGSERAGSAVAAAAGQNLKKVVLELGGSDPFIVLDSADLPQVAKTAAAARMENAGQACNAVQADDRRRRRLRRVRREFTAAMAAQVTGDPTDPATNYGPLSSEQAAQNLMEQIDDAVSKGATVHTGGHRVDRPGAFVEATVLSGVTPEMRAFSEELFGPAAVVYRVADADEAVELANSSAYGLGGAVFTQRRDAGRWTWPTGSTSAWSGSTRPRAAARSCRSAAPSAPASGASSARSASTSSSTRSSSTLRPPLSDCLRGRSPAGLRPPARAPLAKQPRRGLLRPEARGRNGGPDVLAPWPASGRRAGRGCPRRIRCK